MAGIYTDSDGHLGSVLTTGSRSHPEDGTWNTISVGAAPVRARHTYWIAILGKGGPLYFRDRSAGRGVAITSRHIGLRSLTAAWGDGLKRSRRLISAYVEGTVSVPTAGTATLGTTNTAGTPDGGGSGTGGPLSSPATGSVPPSTTLPSLLPPINTASPQITGIATQGQTLTTSDGSWLDNPSTYAYQWQDCTSSGAGCVPIIGASASTYTLQASDVGHTIRAAVAASNTAGSSAATSAPTATVAAPAPPTAAFTYSPANPVTNQAVNFDATDSTCPDGPCSYTWADDPPSDGSWPLGTGQTMSFTFQQAATKYVTLTVTDSLNRTATVEHNVVVGSPPPATPSNTALPAVSGTAQQGQTLTTSKGSWNGSPTSYAYAWEDCNSSGTGCTTISGATSSSYTLAASDVNDTIRAVVTASNSSGSTSATSNQTAVVTSSSGGGSNTNCFQVSNGAIDYAQLDQCGYPSPDTTGVPSGTALTTVSSINCSNTTINAVYTTGSVTIGSNCTITNSRMIGGITVEAGPTNVNLSHDEISGPYTGSPTSPSCSSDNSTDLVWEGDPSGVTLNYDYLHCASEPFNGNGIVENSYVISDECWGPCGSSSTTHNEAAYIAGGNDPSKPGTDLEHNTFIDPFGQTAAVFGDDHAYGPLYNLTVNNNLVASGGDGIDDGIPSNGNQNITVTNNRFSFAYNANMPPGPQCGEGTYSNNYRDDNLAQIPCTS